MKKIIIKKILIIMLVFMFNKSFSQAYDTTDRNALQTYYSGRLPLPIYKKPDTTACLIIMLVNDSTVKRIRGYKYYFYPHKHFNSYIEIRYLDELKNPISYLDIIKAE